MKSLVPHARALFAIGFGLVSVAGIASVTMVLRTADADQWVAHTLEVREGSTRLLSEMQSVETSQQGFLLTSNEEYLESFQRVMPLIPTSFDALRQLTSDNPEQQQRLTRLQSLADAKLDVLRSTLTMARQGQHSQAMDIVKFNRGKELMDDFESLLTEFSQQELGLLTTRQATAAALRGWLLVLICSSLVSALSLAALLGRTTQQGINKIRDRTAELEAEVTLRRETQDALRQSQKLEAVGQLRLCQEIK